MIDTSVVSNKQDLMFTQEDEIIWSVLVSQATFAELREMWADFEG